MPGWRFRNRKLRLSLPPFENIRVSVRFPRDVDKPHSNHAAPIVPPPKLTLPFSTHELSVISDALFVMTVRGSFVLFVGASPVVLPAVVNVWTSPSAPRP